MSKLVLAVIVVPFFIGWQLLRLVAILLWRLPEPFWPRLRHRRQISRFKRRAKAVRQRAEKERDDLSHAKAKRNAIDLADEVLRKLRVRQRDIAPNVFERARPDIRTCGERADVDRMVSCFTLLTESAAAQINTRLIAWEPMA